MNFHSADKYTERGRMTGLIAYKYHEAELAHVCPYLEHTVTTISAAAGKSAYPSVSIIARKNGG
ncbi:MAG: hypothetical protein RSD08_03215 [Oscillospiraceae bacterium]